MKKAIFLSLALVGSALSANVFMGPEYAKELCEVWNKTPRLTEELGKSESWTKVPERKIFPYREDCSADKQIQLTIRNKGIGLYAFMEDLQKIRGAKMTFCCMQKPKDGKRW